MVSVTARKIRELGSERPGGANGRIYTGYLISYPYIGRGMVIFRRAEIQTVFFAEGPAT